MPKKHDHGAIKAKTGGRTDVVNLKVPENAFVIPADIVSALGEGNSDSGYAKLDEMFGTKKKSNKYKSGGKVHIVAAGGEYIVSPEKIIEKFGDLDHGHAVLDHFVKHVRSETVKTLQGLDPPRQ